MYVYQLNTTVEEIYSPKLNHHEIIFENSNPRFEPNIDIIVKKRNFGIVLHSYMTWYIWIIFNIVHKLYIRVQVYRGYSNVLLNNYIEGSGSATIK